MDDVRARFGAMLRAWRHRRDLTQEQLAERSGLSYKFIGEVERGTGNPTLDTLARLAGALGIGLADLLAEPNLAPSSTEYRISKRQVQLFREAAASLEALVENLAPVTYTPKKRRRS